MALADIPVVHVIGAPRSGTTWLQLMLGSHPRVATPIELAFFSDFAAPWYETWTRQCTGADRIKPPYWGLPAALTENEFEQAVGLVVERIYRSVLEAKPGATLVVEKDPQSSRCVEAVLRTVPQVRFVHVLRDGRDAVCSTRRVSRSWGGAWAPRDLRAAAELWREYVRGAQTARVAPGGYMEVRYEDLLSGAGQDVLRETMTFCGLDDDPALAKELYERYSYPAHGKEKVLKGGLVWTGEMARAGIGTDFPEDFIGPAAAGVWKTEFSAAERQEFDSAAGDLLVELGYEDDRSWAGGPTRDWSPIPTRG